ncbi:MAG: phosphotransferase [Paracoccaceae bacterium]
MSRNRPPPLELGAAEAVPPNLGALFERPPPDQTAIELVETSKSWVFLTPTLVYKVKKPVRDELQDLTSLRARQDNTLTEIDLNRRLAPEIYLGAQCIFEDPEGAISLHGPGRPRDWMVKMRRLPGHRMLSFMIRKCYGDETLLGTWVGELASTLVAFYKTAPRSHLTGHELLSLLKDQQRLCRKTLLDPRFARHRPRFEAVLNRFERGLPAHLNLLAERAEHGRIRECHGDLRPEHICLQDPPVIFDCLEFNRNLRLLDPFSEVVFLGMECDRLGAPWIKPLLIDALKLGLQDHPPRRLLLQYEVIHALLRARLCLAHLLVPHPRTPEKWEPLGLEYFAIAERLCGLKPPA